MNNRCYSNLGNLELFWNYAALLGKKLVPKNIFIKQNSLKRSKKIIIAVNFPFVDSKNIDRLKDSNFLLQFHKKMISCLKTSLALHSMACQYTPNNLCHKWGKSKLMSFSQKWNIVYEVL